MSLFNSSNMPLDALEAKLDEIVRQNELLVNENELFDSYLKRNAQISLLTEEDDKKDKTSRNRNRRQKAQASLTIEQKNEIGCSELEEIQKEILETKRSSERLIDTLRAVLEETDIRIAELKKDAYEFKRDIVVGAENFRTGKTMAEKVIRYMEEKLRQKDATIEKLKLKNATLKSQAQKVEAQLRQKEEMGDVLHYIDFHQLQIENKQYVAKIEERNDELLKLKMTTGNTVQVLNNLKRRLNSLIEESASLNREIKERLEMNEKIKEDSLRVQEDIIKESKIKNKLLSRQDDNSEMPQILDYVGQKAEMYELQQEIKSYERKVEIASMAIKIKKKDLRKATSNNSSR